MNKHLYRIIFNHALGLFQAVSELVRRPGQGASKQGGLATAAVRPVSLGLWAAFGWIGLASVASAQITSDMHAPGNQRPTVMGAPNAAPLINITTPSKAGVSRNTYADFNVSSAGSVLNNSRTNTQTQLAGTVGGNPWLATGTAKVILNEVTGPNPSQLNGYLEVAGDRAQVIIANPSGIACDGCGFINASRVTMTTGTPVLHGGSLDGYRVTGGTIQVNGKGMDASRADYADIIARAVQVNGGIWSPELKVTTGTNQVSADQAQVTPVAGNGAAPTFALDVSALGGMYANKIQLLGTEHGVGARNAGNIGAQAGELTVTVDGRLENTATGQLQSQTDNTRMDASGGIANAGLISAARELTLTTPQDIDNSAGTLNAARIDVTAGSLRNQSGTITQTGTQAMTLQSGAFSNNGGMLGAPVAATDSGGSTPATPGTHPPSTDGAASTGTIGGTTGTPGVTLPAPLADDAKLVPLRDGALHIAGTLNNDGGRISANAGLDLATDNGLSNDGGHLALRQLTLTQGDLSNRGGDLTIDGATTLHANTVTNDAGTLTFTGPLQLDAQQLSNRAGTISQLATDATAITVAGTLDNTDGVLNSNASSLALTSGTLINERGAIHHAGTAGLTVQTGALHGASGTIATAGNVLLNASAVDHRGATLSATQVIVNATNLDNRGGTLAATGADANILTVTNSLDNGDGGTLASNGDLTIQANVLGNAGGNVNHAGTGTLRIDADTLNGAGGTIGSNGTLTITGNATDLSGGTTIAQHVAIDTGTLSTAHGQLSALSGDRRTFIARSDERTVHERVQGRAPKSGKIRMSSR